MQIILLEKENVLSFAKWIRAGPEALIHQGEKIRDKHLNLLLKKNSNQFSQLGSYKWEQHELIVVKVIEEIRPNTHLSMLFKKINF